MCFKFAIEWVGLLNYEVIVVLAFWLYKFPTSFFWTNFIIFWKTTWGIWEVFEILVHLKTNEYT
jgi:hypothetical protein